MTGNPERRVWNGLVIDGPRVLQIHVMGIQDGFEFIAGVLDDGEECTVVLNGTDLQGWCNEPVHRFDGSLFLDAWVEVGRRADKGYYIALLLSSGDFDRLYREQKDKQLPDAYEDWKALHRVSDTVTFMELYYLQPPIGSV